MVRFTWDKAFATKSSAKLDKDLIALYSLPFQLFTFLIGQETIKFMNDKKFRYKIAHSSRKYFLWGKIKYSKLKVLSKFIYLKS